MSSSMLALRHVRHSYQKKHAVLGSAARAMSSEAQAPKKKGFLDKLFGEESNVASEGFKNRWAMLLPAAAAHVCIGSPYAWSIVADIATREVGFVAPAAADWTLMEAAFPLSLVFATQGIVAGTMGKWQQKVGVRKSLAVAGGLFGGGVLLGSLGFMLHSLPLVYFGYGILGGAGLGFGYTPPIQTLYQWFPDKKGVASGIIIAGFGCGPLVFTPCVQYLTKKFAKLPEYLGRLDEVSTNIVDGKLFADVNGKLIEVIAAGPTELAKLSYSGLQEGVYVVGTGSSGAAETLAVMGATYFSIIMASALAIKKPHPNYTVAAPAPVGNKPAAAPVVVPDVSVDDAMKTVQFHLLGATCFCLATGGLGMFSVAKPMMTEVFSNLYPGTVTSAFSAQFLLMLAGGSLAGRIGWATLSDIIGRRKMFHMFTFGAIPLYLSIPTLVGAAVTSGSISPLYAFIGTTVAAGSVMGGMYACLPAYEADLFGTKNTGPIHGRMLLYSSGAALAGPSILINLRQISEKAAISDLVALVSPEKFEATFGATVDKVNELYTAKAITISKLMAIVPPGTVDPTPHIYDSTMYAMSGLMALAVVAHSAVRPLKKAVVVEGKGTDLNVEQKVGDRLVK